MRGSNGMDHVERIKILKLMWDAIGSEFGGRHELYEINYSGSQDEIRLQCLRQAQSSGNMDKMMAMVDRCCPSTTRTAGRCRICTITLISTCWISC